MGTNNAANYVPVNHNIILGGASGAINNLAPAAASTVLRSTGTSADPGWTTNFKISSADVMTNTKQPAFQVYLANNQTGVTGDNTLYTLPFDTVVVDQASNFTTGASALFTAPVDGFYFFSVGVEVYNIAADNTSGLFQLTRDNGTFWTGGLFNWANLRNSGNACIPTASFLIHLAATNTITAQIQINGHASKNCNVAGGTSTQYLTYWMGFLAC